MNANHVAMTPSPQTMVLGNSEANQPIALPPGVTFSNLAQVLAPNGVSVQYMYQTQQVRDDERLGGGIYYYILQA